MIYLKNFVVYSIAFFLAFMAALGLCVFLTWVSTQVGMITTVLIMVVAASLIGGGILTYMDFSRPGRPDFDRDL